MENSGLDIGELLRQQVEKDKAEYVVPDLKALMESGVSSTLDSGKELEKLPQTKMGAPLGKLFKAPDGSIADLVVIKGSNILVEVSWKDPALTSGMVRLAWQSGTVPVEDLRSPTEEEMKSPSYKRGKYEIAAEYNEKTQHSFRAPGQGQK